MKNQELPPQLRRPPLAIAHRGGAMLEENLGKENSLEAFANAAALGYDYIETDLRTTRDGEVFAFHDPDLKRVFGKDLQFRDLTAEDVRSLRLADDARIVTLGELLFEFPDVVFNIDFKDATGIPRGLDYISTHEAHDRVVVASFAHAHLQQVRSADPQVLTTASQREVARLRFGMGLAKQARPLALQIPERHAGIKVLTPRLIRKVHERGMQVHVWTVDDPRDMNRLLDSGVDGIITDRPDILKQVLMDRNQWSE